MSYADFAASRAGGGPIQLFRFVYGQLESEVIAYTSHTEEVTVDHGGSVGVVTYAPVPVSRDNIVSNGTLDKSSVQVSLDVGTELAELFRVYPPSNVVSLFIYEGHIDDPDEEYLVIWAGRIITAARVGSELQLSGEPIATQMRRPGLRRHYQYGCPHALYGTQCGASKAAATVSATVSSISGTEVTLVGGWEGAFAAAKFLRGTLEWTPYGKSLQVRSILRVTGDVLTISGIPTDLEAADTVDVVLGCNHKAFSPEGDCQALHDNIVNFGGQPWIPTKNVINRNPFY